MITRRTLLAAGALVAAGLGACRTTLVSDQAIVSLENARWLVGGAFEPKQGWSVNGRFTFSRPARVNRVLDLTGTCLIPPFADAHNHGIGTGDEERDRTMISRYLRDGVFYMQSMGNAPLTRADRERLGLNGPNGVDAVLSQGTITGIGGHPMGLLRNVLLPRTKVTDLFSASRDGKPGLPHSAPFDSLYREQLTGAFLSRSFACAAWFDSSACSL